MEQGVEAHTHTLTDLCAWFESSSSLHKALLSYGIHFLSHLSYFSLRFFFCCHFSSIFRSISALRRFPSTCSVFFLSLCFPLSIIARFRFHASNRFKWLIDGDLLAASHALDNDPFYLLNLKSTNSMEIEIKFCLFCSFEFREATNENKIKTKRTEYFTTRVQLNVNSRVGKKASVGFQMLLHRVKCSWKKNEKKTLGYFCISLLCSIEHRIAAFFALLD